MGHTDLQDEPQSQRATLVDRHVGRRIRARRVMMELSQQQLAHIIGVTYQQAHKYERGLNRVSAGRLFSVAQALAVDPAWFFEGMSEQVAVEELAPRQRMLLELMRNYSLIDTKGSSKPSAAWPARSQAHDGSLVGDQMLQVLP